MLRQLDRYETPRRAFIADLMNFIQERQEQNSGILLFGDFNEALTDDSENISKLCSDCYLCDLMLQLTGRTNFATYVKGTKRIDFVLCSDWIASAARQGCYEPFGHRTKGDHRSFMIDFNTVSLFGNDTQPLGSIATREFTSKDRSANRIYMQQKYKYLTQHNFEARLKAVKESFDPTMAEQLDRDFQRSGKVAAKRCKKKPTNTAYVKALAELRVKKNILLKTISQIRLRRSYASGIQHCYDKGIEFEIPSTLDECKTQLRSIQRQITEMTKTAISRRVNEQKARLQEAEQSGDKPTVKAIRHRIAAERTKQMYAKIRQCRGNEKSGITRLNVPADPDTTDYDNCTEWITIDTPADIEERLLQRNQRHFGQASNTFPTIPPFSKWVDWGSSSHTAELILEGNWDSDELDDLSTRLVKHMKARTTLDSIKPTISIDDWVGKIKSWPESTSTSPSGFHLSHSKALIGGHDLDPKSDEGRELEQIRTKLIEWQVDLINIAIKNNYSYERWQHVVNVMILKEPNNFKINRLRVIHLYEQDYNLILAIKWRDLIRQSTNNQLLHPTQFGGVPGKDAVLPTLIEELQYEISRATKRPLVHLDYDATACYDRITMNLGSLVSRTFGQHRSIAFINARTLEEAKYYLKTQLGVSERHYKHCLLYPIYGSGQGAGNSPALWCVISTMLFETYDESAHGATFTSPDCKITTRVFMVGFVDDTSGSVNDFHLPEPAPVEHYIERATADARRWNSLLSLSGGALNNKKCSYHFLHYKFTLDGLALPTAGSFGPSITIQFTPDEPPTPLKQLSAYASHKTLGAQKAPTSTNKQLYVALDKKNTAHAQVIARSPFTKTDAWSYYHSIYLPSITYPFPSLTISDDHCDKLQRKFKAAFLPKYGYNRNMPNAVVYGATEYGGLGLRALSTERGVSQIYCFLACLRSSGVAADLSQIAISWGQYLAGTSFPILSNPNPPLPHLEPMTWLPQVRDFLSRIDCSIDLATDFRPPLQREHDKFLMDAAISGQFSDLELQLINACRLFLGVTLVSDITSPKGDMIESFAIQGQDTPTSTAKGLLPYQDRPSTRAWTLWQRFLEEFASLTLHGYVLTDPLGKWLVTGSSTHRQWKEYLVPSEAMLYRFEQGSYTLHMYTHPRFVSTPLTTQHLPPTAIPVQTSPSSHGYTLLPYQGQLSVPSTPRLRTFDSFINDLPPWENQLLKGFRILTDLDDLLTVFNFSGQVSLVTCSDGSAPQFTGTFGCVCSTMEGQRLFGLNGPAPGYRTNSFRAESYGFLAILRIILRLCEYHAYELPSTLALYTDSESLIKTIFKRLDWSIEFPYSTMHPDWDLQQCISTSLRKFPTMPSISHVKGHQDRFQPVSTLPLPAQLNVEADELASAYKYPPTETPTCAPLIEGSTVTLRCPLGTIHSNYRAVIRRLAQDPVIRQYLCNKFDWSPAVIDTIDWYSHGIANRAFFSRRHFVSKFIFEWLPLGNLKSKYAEYYVDHCPACSTPTLEDAEHFLRCPQRRSWLGPMLDDLRSHWDDQSVAPALQTLFSDALHHWLDDTPLPTSYASHLYPLLTTQNIIGWKQLFYGRMSTHWASIQDSHLKSHDFTSPKLRGHFFVSGSIKIIWHHAHRLWLRRNEDTHVTNPETQEIAAYAQAQREVTALYNMRHLVHPSDQTLFYSSLDQHFTIDTSSISLRSWINTWRPVILRSASLFSFF